MRFAQLRRVDLNLLVAFCELADTQSVTLAAARLGITQPAMSRTLGRLRTTFGDPLFVRGPTGLTKTPRAAELLPRAEAWLLEAESLVGATAGFDPKTAERTFLIATADYGEAVLLPKLLARLEREAPSIRVRVAPQVTLMEQALERGELDLIWAPKMQMPRTVVWTHLFHETFGYLVRKGHPILKKPFTLDRYLSLRHVALAPSGRSTRNPIDDLLAKQGHKRNVVATVPNFLVVPSLVEGSDLGVMLPKRLIDVSLSRYQLVTLPLPIDAVGFSLHQGWHERQRRDRGHAWFRQLVVDVAKDI